MTDLERELAVYDLCMRTITMPRPRQQADLADALEQFAADLAHLNGPHLIDLYKPLVDALRYTRHWSIRDQQARFGGLIFDVLASTSVGLVAAMRTARNLDKSPPDQGGSR